MLSDFSQLSVGYQLVVSRLLGRLGYQSVNCQLSGSCQAVVRQLSGSCQAVVRQSSGSRLAVVRQLGSCQADVKQSSGKYAYFVL